MQEHELVLHIAKEVRAWAEDHAAEKGWKEDLCGMCAIASGELQKRLAVVGIAAEIHVWTSEEDGWTSHVYVVVDDHVVDVTATQFREMKQHPVYIVHKREAEVHEWYRGQHQFESSKELVRWQRRKQWHQQQIAYA